MTGSVSPWANIAVAVLAAGESRRFGADKLMAELDDMPLALHVVKMLAKMPFGWHFAVCSKSAVLMQHFSAAGFVVIKNSTPELGQSHSLHLVVKAAEATGAQALLVVLADMPFVTPMHIDRLVSAGPGIIASTDGHRPMPPAIFPRAMWPQLLATTGDAGARELLSEALLVTASADELRDIDVPADLPRPTA